MASGPVGMTVKSGRRGLFRALGAGAVLGLGASRAARAATAAAPLDVTRFVYAASATTPEVFLVSTDANAITARVKLGLVAQQMLINRGDGLVIAGGDATPSLALAGAFGGNLRHVALPEPVGRLTSSSDGTAVAVMGASGRSITIVDIDGGSVRTSMSGLPRVRDLMFGAQDKFIYVAADGLDGVGIVDLGAGRVSRTIAGETLDAAGFSTLARTADGRRVLALGAATGPIDVIDAAQGKSVAQLAGQGALGIYPSSIAGYVMVPNGRDQTLAVYKPGQFTGPAILPGAAKISGVYSTWLDSIAFMPSQDGQSVLAYDLDHMRALPAIPVNGVPGKGVVTADTATLYLPVGGPPRLLAVDGATQRVAHVIDLPAEAQVVATAGGAGLCH